MHKNIQSFSECTWWLEVAEFTLYEKWGKPIVWFLVVFPLLKKVPSLCSYSFLFFSTLFCFLLAQVSSGHAIWLFSNWGEEGLQQSFRRDGQIWPGSDCQIVSISTEFSGFNLDCFCLLKSSKTFGIVSFREEFCEIFRAKDRTTMKMYTCKKFLKKDGRKVRKAAKNEILILKMWGSPTPNPLFFHFLGYPICNIITAGCYQPDQLHFTERNSCTKVQKLISHRERTRPGLRLVGELKKTKFKQLIFLNDNTQPLILRPSLNPWHILHCYLWLPNVPIKANYHNDFVKGWKWLVARRQMLLKRTALAFLEKFLNDGVKGVE